MDDAAALFDQMAHAAIKANAAFASFDTNQGKRLYIWQRARGRWYGYCLGDEYDGYKPAVTVDSLADLEMMWQSGDTMRYYPDHTFPCALSTLNLPKRPP